MLVLMDALGRACDGVLSGEAPPMSVTVCHNPFEFLYFCFHDGCGVYFRIRLLNSMNLATPKWGQCVREISGFRRGRMNETVSRAFVIVLKVCMVH